jgi:hypothetical protein
VTILLEVSVCSWVTEIALTVGEPVVRLTGVAEWSCVIALEATRGEPVTMLLEVSAWSCTRADGL